MSTSLFQCGWVQSWMRTPAWRNLFAGLVSRRDHLRVLALAPGRRAVLAVAGHVEDRAELRLELEGLGDELFVPGEVLARRDHRERPLPLEQGCVWVERLRHGVQCVYCRESYHPLPRGTLGGGRRRGCARTCSGAFF